MISPRSRYLLSGGDAMNMNNSQESFMKLAPNTSVDSGIFSLKNDLSKNKVKLNSTF